MKVIVVGAGLMGSATARHLQEAGASVELIGPDEVASSGPGARVRASFHDVSRIVRPSGHTPHWTRVNQLSIDGLRTFGPEVFKPVGAMTGCGTKRPDTTALRDPYTSTWGDSILPWRFDGPVLIEPQGGVLHPIRLVQAQRTALIAAGGRWTPRVVCRMDGGLQLDGQALDADAVVVAAGAYSAALLGQPSKSRAKSESTWLAEVPESWLERYANAPGWIDDADGDGWSGRYAVGPRRYPDGKVYVKIGMDLATDAWMSTGEIGRWFDHGHPNTEEVLRTALDDLWPGLGEHPGRLKRCVVAYSDSGLPNIEEVTSGLWWVGPGNGYSAMASDGLGRMAAAAILNLPSPLLMEP